MKKNDALPTPTIERGIKIPSHRNGSALYAKILGKMKAGDSIIVPRPKASCWYVAGRTRGIKVVTRRISESQTRVWRVA